MSQLTPYITRSVCRKSVTYSGLERPAHVLDCVQFLGLGVVWEGAAGGGIALNTSGLEEPVSMSLWWLSQWRGWGE